MLIPSWEWRRAEVDGKRAETVIRACQRAAAIERLAALPVDEAAAKLQTIQGIGPWTAECYLLFAAGHPDVFPARDVALQSAVGHALGIAPRPPEKALVKLAESWSPWRGVASRLFWAYYRELKGRDAAPPA